MSTIRTAYRNVHLNFERFQNPFLEKTAQDMETHAHLQDLRVREVLPHQKPEENDSYQKDKSQAEKHEEQNRRVPEGQRHFRYHPNILQDTGFRQLFIEFLSWNISRVKNLEQPLIFGISF